MDPRFADGVWSWVRVGFTNMRQPWAAEPLGGSEARFPEKIKK